MKVLYLGTSGRHTSDKYRLKGFFEGGIHVMSHDFRILFKAGGIKLLRDTVIHAIYSFQPDIVLVNKGEKFTAEMIDEVKSFFPKIPWLLFYGDIRDNVTDFMKRNLPAYDALLINAEDEAYWDMYRKAGAREVFYHHSATDTDIFEKDMSIVEKYDIGFFGGNYLDSFPNSMKRARIVEVLSRRYKMLLHGSRWGDLGRPVVYGEDYARAASTCKILLGISNYNRVRRYTSNRTFNSMATGFVIHQWYNGIETMFTNKKHLVWFTTFGELFKNVSVYLENTKARHKIYKAGREKMIEEHSYTVRARELIDIVNKLKKV